MCKKFQKWTKNEFGNEILKKKEKTFKLQIEDKNV